MRLREEVPEALAGERLDRVVAMMSGRSRAEVAELVSAGQVLLDGRTATSRSTRVGAGEVVEVEVPDLDEVRRLAPDPSVLVPVVHEDEHLVVVDKPAGLVVHPGAGQQDGTLVHGLLARYPEVAEVGVDPVRPGIVHRLDKDTSGLIVVAKHEAARLHLLRQWQGREVVKRYTALAHGVIDEEQATIDAPIGRHPHDRKRMAVIAGGRPAVTHFTVLERFPEATLLDVTIETGRTHQIRVHLAFTGHPVVGDETYGKRPFPVPVPRQFLHARYLRFVLPSSGRPI